jgi:surface antigen Omp85-like protein
MSLILKKLIVGPSLAHTVGMRTLGLLVTLLALAPQASPAQRSIVPEGTRITTVEVSGVDARRLSPGLQEEIRELAGTPLNQERLTELAARIEVERPRYVAAWRAVMDPGGEIRVMFVAVRRRDRDQPDQEENVNARYVVERAEIEGVPDSELTETLRDDLLALVDKRLDSGDAQQIEQRIRQALPRYDISRRIARGSEPGRIRLLYEARRNEQSRWLRFEARQSNVIFHSEQGWGSYLELAVGGRDLRFTPIVAIDNADDLIEEYSGFGLRFETRRLGTERLGASLEWTAFDPTWRNATLDALAGNPEIARPYDDRSTITPLVKFAVTPQVTLAAGVSITELDALPPATGSEMANAAVASIAYGGRWKDTGSATHDVHASFGVRAGSRALESDLAYTRYLGRGWYRYGWGNHRVLVTAMAGGITGDAPLFERFALGDSTTLRGWDKYDIAPAGGDRMVHASVEYAFRGIAVFLDVGSVWDEGRTRDVRVSTGLGFQAGPAFLTVGFPLNTDHLGAAIALGLRLGGSLGVQR